MLVKSVYFNDVALMTSKKFRLVFNISNISKRNFIFKCPILAFLTLTSLRIILVTTFLAKTRTVIYKPAISSSISYTLVLS